jgi:hypothetical protein
MPDGPGWVTGAGVALIVGLYALFIAVFYVLYVLVLLYGA